MAHDSEKYQSGPPPSPEHLSEEIIVSPDTRRANRIPPGQVRTRKWPVLQAGQVPQIDRDQWQLEINGLVERPMTFHWQQFQNLPRVKVFSDFHCVTRWSRLGNLWEGVSVREVLRHAGPKQGAKFVIATGYDDNYTTNLPLEPVLADDALLADSHDDTPLSADHGGPVRLIVPALYAWKSAKWLRSLTLVAEDDPGFWERLGYHNRGDPWSEQRYS